MAATITVNLSVQVSSGTQIKLPPQIKIEGVEAHKKFEFTLNNKDEDKKKQEVGLEEKLIFLAISSDDLEEKPVELTFAIGDSNNKIVLDTPQIFLKGGIAILKNPRKLVFELSPKPASSTTASNASTEKVEVKVEVLAGYDFDLKPLPQQSQPDGEPTG